MECEEEERGGDKDGDFEDPFIAEGLLSSSSSSGANMVFHGNTSQHHLQAGKAKQERLKWALFHAKEDKQRARDMEYYGSDADSE